MDDQPHPAGGILDIHIPGHRERSEPSHPGRADHRRGRTNAATHAGSDAGAANADTSADAAPDTAPDTSPDLGAGDGYAEARKLGHPCGLANAVRHDRHHTERLSARIGKWHGIA